MSYFLAALRKYADFSGRARRSEYWYFLLFYWLIGIALVGIDALIGTLSFRAGVGLLSTIYSVVTIVPTFAVLFRRLHDTDRSGWWILIGVLPLIGAVVLLVFCVQDSQPGSNRYGPNPKTD